MVGARMKGMDTTVSEPLVVKLLDKLVSLFWTVEKYIEE